MSFAEIKKLKELLKTLQESGEISTRTRMEVGKAIEAIRKERAAARTGADVNIEQPLNLFESSYEKSTALGEIWKPPWDPTWEPLSKVGFLNKPRVLNPRAFDINLNRGTLHAINELTSGGEYGSLSPKTKEILLSKLNYRMRLEEEYAALFPYHADSAASVKRKIDTLDESIYRMGATQWDERRGIPLDWMNTNKAYETPTSIEQLSGQFFIGNRITGALGSDLLSSQSPKKILAKTPTIPDSYYDAQKANQQEIEFINNFLLNPEMAAEYAKTAPLSFFKYWSEKGGTLGLKEHMQSLKAAARAEDIELETAKWGALTTVKDVKSKNFAFASLRGQVTELWEPSSPKISQVGLFQDATGEKIKFTIWKNQQQNIPKVEVGKNYYFGNVASSEYQGRWNLNVNRFSAIEEIKPMPFNIAPPLIVPGRSVELRDYSKPYSIDPIKGTITYTTKSGTTVDMPIEKADLSAVRKQRPKPPFTPYDRWAAQEERSLFDPYAAVVPFAGIPFLQGNVTGGTAQIDSQLVTRQNAGEQVLESLTGAYNVTSELMSIWGRKISETYSGYKERDIEYRREMASGTMSPYRKYLPMDFGASILEGLGAALYPLAYPGQALWGEKEGIGAMEGIRRETRASEVLDIENPLAALGADIALDPVNLVFLPGLAKKSILEAPDILAAMKAGRVGVGRMLADESAMTAMTGSKRSGYVEDVAKAFGRTPEEQLAIMKGEANPWEKATPIIPSPLKPLVEEKPINVLMAEYDARPLSTSVKSRLDELSSRPYQSLSLAEKSELDSLAFQDWSKGIGALTPELTPLTQDDWLNVDRYNTDIQKRMNEKIYGNKGPTATVGGKPVVPISEAEKEESLRKLEAYRKLLAVPIEEPVPTKVVTAFPKRKAPAISTAVGTDETEAMTREVIARRESRGEATTPEDIKRIRESVLNNAKDSIEYQARKADEKRFPWGTLALGTGVGAAATASLFSLPQEEQEAGREQVREALKPSEEQGILGTFVDVVSMDSYLEGAAIMNARAMLTGDARRYGWEDRITPSIALGIQDKDTSLFSLQGLAGTALDIAIAPTTYLSFGSGAAVKIGSIGGKGAKAMKLSKKGVKELKTFTEKYGGEMGTLEFAHHIEQNPAFQKKVLASGGMNLRGWGKEVNLIPGSAFDPIGDAAKKGAMRFSLEHPTTFKKMVGMQEYLQDKFVVRAAIKRLPRSSRLLPMEADYAEKAMLLPKKVRFDIAQGTERDIELAKEARKAFGENYEEIVSNLIEAPVTRESAKLTREQRAIVEELETYNKGFAAAEKELGLLDTEMSGYLRHTLTPEAKKYLEKGGKKVSTELYTPLSVENKFGAKRTIQGTVAEINERARKELGIDFDYFEANPFKATSIRRAESVQAVEQAKFLKWTVEKYGVSEEVARAAPDKYVQSSSKYIEGAWLPKPVAEDIEKEFVQKDVGAALQLYDKALSTWKYGATVTHPAYHATNVIGGMFNNWLAEIDPRSYYRSSRILLGGDKEKVFTTALGDQYTGQELLKMAGESGILSQPGMMDIQKLSYGIADTQTEKSIELAKKLANAPITTAQYEENFIRFSLFNDRIMKGDTVQGAREWVSEFQFQYSKESFTPFERDYMKRAVPFYAWMRGNIPLMGKQLVLSPGKFAQFGKVADAAVEGQELPSWTEGALTWMWPWDESTGTFNYMRTPATDLDILNDPLWYGVGAITPFAKYPAEKALGFNTYTGMDFDPNKPWYDPKSSAESSLVMGRTGRDIVAAEDVYNDRNAGRQIVKYLTGKGQAKTETKKMSDKEIKDMYRKVTGRPNDFSYEQRLQLMHRDNWASAQSGISGEFEQLQGGHFYPADLGGAPEAWNYLTQTREENMEWLSAQLYIENLPERELQREEAWGRYEAQYSAGVEEINARTLDNRGRPENEAQKEKRRYDIRKAANIKMYNRQLNTVRAAIRSAEKDLRGEKKKVEDARAKGYSDPTSEAQIKVIEAVLAEYRALYEKVIGLRDAEQGKEFELPVQGTDLSRFQPMDIGGYDKYAVRYGKGHELAKQEDIEKLVDLKKITAYYAAMKSYGPVAGFMPGTPEAVKNRILFTRDARYQELAQIASPLITGAGWEGVSGKNYIGPRNISELREVVEGSVSEPEPVMGTREMSAGYSDQQVSQEPRQAMEFDYNDPEFREAFREAVREIVQETLSEGIVSD